MQAALLDLARRGVLQIRESSGDPQRFDVVMERPSPAQPHPQGASRPHERAITDALWLLMKNGRVDLRTAWRHLARTLPAFRRSLLTEMQDAGLVDAERRTAARAMRIAGLVVTMLGVAGIVIFAILFGHLGDVPQVVPGAVVISGVGFLIAGQVMSLLSASGVEAAAEWRARSRWLKAAMKDSMNAADVALWFPAAVGFGLARPMLKAGKGDLAPGTVALVRCYTSARFREGRDQR